MDAILPSARRRRLLSGLGAGLAGPLLGGAGAAYATNATDAINVVGAADTRGAPAANDLLSVPARQSAKAARAMLLGVARAGDALVAVGERGIVVRSDDLGKTWRQAAVPVSVTLTAVHFPVPSFGWAVGHDGVVLASADGGRSWRRQFDGNQANALLSAAARRRWEAADKAANQAAKQPANQAVGHGATGGRAGKDSKDSKGSKEQRELKDAEFALEDAKAAAKFGPARPLFDVWFKNPEQGWVAGSFGQLFQTLDGGRTWSLHSLRLPNPEGLHLNALAATPGGALLLAAEAGKLFRSGDGGATWAMLDTGSTGQLYGVRALVGRDGMEVLLAFGFGGKVFRSTNQGAHWQAIPGGGNKAVMAGLVDGASLVLLAQNGMLLRSDDLGLSFQSRSSGTNMALAGAALAGHGMLALCGSHGVVLAPAKARPSAAGGPA